MEIITCGADAMRILIEMIGSKNIICDDRGTDKAGRLLSVCSVDGLDINKRMVQTGNAVVYPPGSILGAVVGRIEDIDDHAADLPAIWHGPQCGAGDRRARTDDAARGAEPRHP